MVHFPETMRCCQSSAVWAEPIGTALPVMVCRFTCQILVPYRRATENVGSQMLLLPIWDGFLRQPRVPPSAYKAPAGCSPCEL